MHCLVTGAAGFVGSTLCERLLADGHSVIGIDCFTDYYERSTKESNLQIAQANSQFKFVEDDLVELELASLLKGVDWVFHQSAQAGVRASWGTYFDTYTRNNVLATQRLLEAVKLTGTVAKVVYASSSSIYGNAESFPTVETLLPAPVSPYGVTKLAAEHLMQLYASEFGLPTVALRYFTVFGPRQRPDMAFNRFIQQGLKGEELVIYGDGEQSRDFTYIDDIVSANILAAARGPAGEVFNIGGGSVITVNEVLELLKDLIGPLKIRHEARQKGDARHTSADTSKASALLGYAPKVSVKAGLQREVEWLQGLLNK